MVDKKFLIMKNNNTIYRQVANSIMSEIKKFSFLWWKKRLEAHLYLEDIFKFHDFFLYLSPLKISYILFHDLAM